MTFEMTTPMEDMLFYKINSGGDEICRAENDRYEAIILLSESASPTYITYKGKDYDLCCVHGDDYKELLPKKAIEYIKKYDDWLCGKDSPFSDYSLGNDPDLIIYNKKFDQYIPGIYGDDLAAELDWDERKITEEDFRTFMKFVLEHPHAFEDAEDRVDITGWANGESAKIWLPAEVPFTPEERRKILEVIRDSMHYHIYDSGCAHQYMDYIGVCDILLRKFGHDAEADKYMADAEKYATMSREALDE